MIPNTIQEDQKCLNCGAILQDRYCSKCGQENTEVRQPFYYLFTHFFQDFTSYDSQFWRTMISLLFRPASLTKAYLKGQRQKYVPPVKLYIFVSFITFFIISFLDISVNDLSSKQQQNSLKADSLQAYNLARTAEKPQHEAAFSTPDSAKQDSVASRGKLLETLGVDKKSLKAQRNLSGVKIGNADNLQQYDELIEKQSSMIRKIMRPIAVKLFDFKQKQVPLKDIIQTYISVFISTLPQALFLYLPVFAFILWLFHNKKKWWYFQHGIFTLHYFSFLLINIALFTFLGFFSSYLERYAVFDFLYSWLKGLALAYGIVYFFIAHQRYYETSVLKSIGIGLSVFLINLLAFCCMIILLASVSLLIMG